MADEMTGKKPGEEGGAGVERTMPRALRPVAEDIITGCSTHAGMMVRATTSTATGLGSRAGGAAR